MPEPFLPFQLGPLAALYMAVVVLASAFVRGYSGFGFSALVVSASALVTSPLNFVPVVMMLEVAATAGQARAAWADLDRRLFALMLAGALVAMPVSVAVLARLDIDTVRLVFSLFILVMSLALFAGWTLHRRVGALGVFGVGLASGVANAAAVGGLPVALFLAAQSIAARVFRATMIFYLCAIDLGALPMLGFNGILQRDSFIAAAISLPLLGLGVWLGGRRFLSAEPASFRRMAIGLLAALAAMGLVKSLL